MENKYEYYITNLRYRGQLRFFIWYMDVIGSERDGVLTDAGRVLTFKNENELYMYAAKKRINVIDNRNYSLWDNNIRSHFKYSDTTEDCRYFNSLWNIVNDINNSIGRVTIAERRFKHIDRIYRKMFWGNNLEALTPEGEEFIPFFNTMERIIIQALHKSFLITVRKAIFKEITAPMTA